MNLGLVAILALLCAALTASVHLLSRARGWTTQRRLGRQSFPTPPTSEGGLAFLLGVLLCLAVSVSWLGQDILLSLGEMHARHIGLAVGLLWVWGAGRWADSKGKSHLWTAGILVIGGSILAGSGFLIPTLRVGDTVFDLGWMAFPAAVLWLVIISEFFRLFDGLDGLLVTLAILAVAAQLAWVLPPEEGYARALCYATLPPLIALLPWRIYPARIELRGIGAFLPGFLFGAITMVGREKAFTTKAVLLPTVVVIAVFSLFCLWLLEQHLFLPKKKRTSTE